jgi:hypothetical protein
MKHSTILVAAAFLLGTSLPVLAQDAQKNMQPNNSQHGKTMFEEMDTNNDGVISKDEFMASAGKRFDKIDANHDGKISHDEVEAFHKAQLEKLNKMREELKKQQAQQPAAAPAAPAAPAKAPAAAPAPAKTTK